MVAQKKRSKRKYIFVVFTMTNTNIGKLIRIFTRNKYSHVSLAFEHDLRKMYSFARYHINSPISGGFVIEHPGRFLYGNNDVNIKVCRLSVSQREYDRIQKEITYFTKHKEKMIYNTLNAMLSIFKISLKAKNTYTCIEFITYILNIKKITSIKDMENRLEDCVIYQGSLKRRASTKYQFDDEYFIRRQVMGIVLDTIVHIRKILIRLVSSD